jgi:hypothetical protein
MSFDTCSGSKAGPNGGPDEIDATVAASYRVGRTHNTAAFIDATDSSIVTCDTI